MGGDGNYIKISRNILEWEWYRNINTKVLFLHMLLKANWKEGRFEGTTVPRGSFISSYPRLCEECDLTINELRTPLKHVTSTGEITVKTQSKYSVFTVNNYSLYQDINSQTTVNQQSDTSQCTDKAHSINSLLTTIEEGKKEKREELEEEKEGKKKDNRNYQEIITLYNSLCKSYPHVTKLSDKRRRAIGARLNSGYTADDFRKLFELAEQSEFLKGKNNKNWSATFDWLISDGNMAKVLDGNYSNRPEPSYSPVGKQQDKQNESREMMYNWAMSRGGEE